MGATAKTVNMNTRKQVILTPTQLHLIADSLDTSLRCFYQFSTGEVVELIDRDHPYYDPLDELEEDWKKVDDHPDDYLELERMSSSQSFRVTEAFIDEVSNQQLAARLLSALERPKPFRNFKSLVDDSEYRELWFKFKKNKTAEWIKEQIDDYNRESEQI